MNEVITRDDIATRPGGGVSKHLHENRRADYLNGWWPVVNWQEAERRYERSDHSAEQRREAVRLLPLVAFH
jgi:Iron/manganese superoxide dismutases, C-terminal domain